jgi:hypothetical protein
MDRPAIRPNLSLHLLARSLVLGMFIAIAVDAEAQTSGQGGSTTSQPGAAAAPAGADRRGANRAPAPPAAAAAQPRNAPSEAYRESIRRTVEKRRQRRTIRGQGMGDSRPIGGIVPWPMPPALIIRHTPQVHNEIDSFLGLLRK